MSKTAIISIDGHVRGSRAEYREYVPKKYLDTFDEAVKTATAEGTPDAGNLHPEFAPEVQWDSDLRLEKLGSIGVVGEVLFSNGQPFQVNRLDDFVDATNIELGEVGRGVYNRWLVDFCAKAPEQRRGQMSMSFADVDEAVKDVYWAKEHGLGGIALPGLTRGESTSSIPTWTPSGTPARRPASRSASTAGASTPTAREAARGSGARPPVSAHS